MEQLCHNPSRQFRSWSEASEAVQKRSLQLRHLNRVLSMILPGGGFFLASISFYRCIGRSS
jgi:hypothetical protein